MNIWSQAASQGQALGGSTAATRRAEDAIRAGTVMSLRRMVAVVALARSGPVSVAAAQGEVERDHCEHQPGCVRGEPARGQVRHCGVLQVGVDLLDDRVPTVGLVRGHGVEHLGVGGGEEGMEPPGVEERLLPVLGLRVEVGIRRTTNRPGTRSAFFWVAKAVKSISATSAREIHLPVASSKTASVYSMLLPRLVVDRGDRGLDLGVHAHGDRDICAGPDCGADQAAAIERRIGADQRLSIRQRTGGLQRVGDQALRAARGAARSLPEPLRRPPLARFQWWSRWPGAR